MYSIVRDKPTKLTCRISSNHFSLENGFRQCAWSMDLPQAFEAATSLIGDRISAPDTSAQVNRRNADMDSRPPHSTKY